MTPEEILSHVDHTLLSPTASWEEIRGICDDGIRYGTASVCIPPSYVKRAKDYVGDRLAVCTVIGFPCGYQKSEIKAEETRLAVLDGADEIDMVINLGDVKNRHFDAVSREIALVRRASEGKVLKVIIETCFLTEEEKIVLCDIVSKSGADYIKTSTGFGTGGATFEDIALFAAHVEKHLKIKAAGGISSLADGEKFLALGADRLGTSRIVKIVKETEK